VSAPVRPAFITTPPDVEPYRDGLFGVAQPRTLDDDHWLIGGIEWESEASYPTSFYALGACYTQASPPARAAKTLDAWLGVSKAFPFAVYGGVACGTIGHSRDEVAARAKAIVEMGGQHAAEQALWGGSGDPAVVSLDDINPVTTNPYATSLTTVAVDLQKAVALCEDWLADHYNGRGVIHAKRGVSSFAANRHLIERDGEAAVTPVGTRWSFGGGYSGSAPGGAAAAAGTTWIYVTGQVLLVRGPEFAPATFEQAITRLSNQEFYIAEQGYLLGIDGPWAAAQVTYA
jgi:hypothetical protein